MRLRGGWNSGVGVLGMGRMMWVGIKIYNSICWGNFYKRGRVRKGKMKSKKYKRNKIKSNKPSSGASNGV